MAQPAKKDKGDTCKETALEAVSRERVVKVGLPGCVSRARQALGIPCRTTLSPC